MKLNKGDVCMIGDYHHFGAMLVQLEHTWNKDVNGNPIDRMWSVFLLDSIDRKVVEHYQGELINPCGQLWVFEYKLIPVELQRKGKKVDLNE